MRRIHSLAAAFLIALAALPAVAQPTWQDDDEYRDRGPEARDAWRRGYERGYDRGYQRGLEEGRRRSQAVAPPPPPADRPTGPIRVSNATYGSDNRSCAATRYVSRLANGKRSFSFKVTNEICGDPDPGKRKELEVTYYCGGMEKTASAREHNTVYMDCSF